MSKTFSLIVATYGRKVEIDNLLKSLILQNYNLSLVEIFIVDQNDKINLLPIIEKYRSFLLIHYLKSNKKGLSYNRNLALSKVNGDIVAFPDDDCCYYPDTLTNVNKFFDNYPNVDVVLGKIYNRKTHNNVIRKWNKKMIKINLFNFYFNYSSITIFTKKNNKFFDINLGVGTKFGSYEDADYIIQLLKQNKLIMYYPFIEVWHSDQNVNFMDKNKIYCYGLGFGAICKKHIGFFSLILFFEALIFHLIKLVFALFKGDFTQVYKRLLSIISRIEGFFYG